MLSADVNCNCFKLVNILPDSGTPPLTLMAVAPETSGNISAAANYLTPINVSATGSIVTPPGGATDLRFGLVDSRANASIYNITVNFSGAGELFYGSTQNYLINYDGAYSTFRYLNPTIGWVVEK